MHKLSHPQLMALEQHFKDRFKIVIYEKDPRVDDPNSENWMRIGRPLIFVEEWAISDGIAVGISDVAQGMMALWDGKKWLVSTQQVESPTYIYSGPYHGYQYGALFKRVA